MIILCILMHGLEWFILVLFIFYLPHITDYGQEKAILIEISEDIGKCLRNIHIPTCCFASKGLKKLE